MEEKARKLESERNIKSDAELSREIAFHKQQWESKKRELANRIAADEDVARERTALEQREAKRVGPILCVDLIPHPEQADARNHAPARTSAHIHLYFIHATHTTVLPSATRIHARGTHERAHPHTLLYLHPHMRKHSARSPTHIARTHPHAESGGASDCG